MNLREVPSSLLDSIPTAQTYPLLFATLSGAHLYGFPSADSDYDVRGVHILPLRAVVGLGPRRDTIEVASDQDGRQIDLVTHDIRKFLALLLKPNGYVLEQIYSPPIIHTTPEHAELKDLARGCITRQHAHHYLGFVRNQWARFEKDRRVKSLLYVYRVLLTGIHLLRTGQVEANLLRLNELFRLPYVDNLVALKTAGGEHGPLRDVDFDFHSRECQRLTAELDQARESSTLPDEPTARAALNDLLLRVRGLVARKQTDQANRCVWDAPYVLRLLKSSGTRPHADANPPRRIGMAHSSRRI